MTEEEKVAFLREKFRRKRRSITKQDNMNVSDNEINNNNNNNDNNDKRDRNNNHNNFNINMDESEKIDGSKSKRNNTEILEIESRNDTTVSDNKEHNTGQRSIIDLSETVIDRDATKRDHDSNINKIVEKRQQIDLDLNDVIDSDGDHSYARSNYARPQVGKRIPTVRKFGSKSKPSTHKSRKFESNWDGDFIVTPHNSLPTQIRDGSRSRSGHARSPDRSRSGSGLFSFDMITHDITIEETQPESDEEIENQLGDEFGDIYDGGVDDDDDHIGNENKNKSENIRQSKNENLKKMEYNESEDYKDNFSDVFDEPSSMINNVNSGPYDLEDFAIDKNEHSDSNYNTRTDKQTNGIGNGNETSNVFGDGSQSPILSNWLNKASVDSKIDVIDLLSGDEEQIHGQRRKEQQVESESELSDIIGFDVKRARKNRRKKKENIVTDSFIAELVSNYSESSRKEGDLDSYIDNEIDNNVENGIDNEIELDIDRPRMNSNSNNNRHKDSGYNYDGDDFRDTKGGTKIDPIDLEFDSIINHGNNGNNRNNDNDNNQMIDDIDLHDTQFNEIIGNNTRNRVNRLSNGRKLPKHSKSKYKSKSRKFGVLLAFALLKCVS